MIDGVVVDPSPGCEWNAMFYHLAAIARVASTEHAVEAILRHAEGRPRISCKILVDGVVVGGDQSHDITLPEWPERRQIRERGVWRFLASGYGLRKMILLGAIGAVILWGAVSDRSVISAALGALLGATLGEGWTIAQWSDRNRVDDIRSKKLFGAPGHRAQQPVERAGGSLGAPRAK